MSLVIPGVQVTVVKEIVSPQLAPAGVLGLVGLTETVPASGCGHATSWNRFLELFGAASAWSLPEAALALANGVSELVVSPVKSNQVKRASVNVPITNNGSTKLELTARAPGSWANDVKVIVTHRDRLGGDKVFDLKVVVKKTDSEEVVEENHRDLVCRQHQKEPRQKGLRYIVDVLDKESKFVSAKLEPEPNPTDDAQPDAREYLLSKGADASAAEYEAALRVLEDEPDVDLVLVAVPGATDSKVRAQIYGAVISHCQRMSEQSKGRIGFGEIGNTIPESSTIAKDATELASNLVSDRFVLLAPMGVSGAVAGRIGSLDYYQSPTFKRLAGLTSLSRDLTAEEQISLLKDHVVPVATQRRRGTILMRGLTTDGDQISVRRVADQAVRGTKMIGELFIGTLNNEQGRGALKQKLIEFLAQMEKDGALVPSTDGTDPAFKVHVSSSQADFAQGIVRMDLAVRPVRAIDYIYATILVQA